MLYNGVTCADLAVELGLKTSFGERDLMSASRAEALCAHVQELAPENRADYERLAHAALAAIAERHGHRDPASSSALGSRWLLPSPDLLTMAEQTEQGTDVREAQTKARQLQEMLDRFGVAAHVVPEHLSVGPTVVRLGILPTASGNRMTRVGDITKLKKDIQRVLAAQTLRLLDPVPGTSVVGIEFPRTRRATVSIREILEDREFGRARGAGKLLVVLGRDLTGTARFFDLRKAPHVLIAGSTGGGKSVYMNVIITSLIMANTPDELELFLVDAKRGVELGPYAGLPHVKALVTSKEEVPALLRALHAHMNARYERFADVGVRDLDEYNVACKQRALRRLPAQVVLIDELASVMLDKDLKKEVVPLLSDLIALGRAAGVHLILATQRPTVDVVDGTIKGQCPTRISFLVPQANDSLVILDQAGAEELLGMGDGLYLDGSLPVAERLQFAFISKKEIDAVVASWRQAAGGEQAIATSRLYQRELPLQQAYEPPQDAAEEDEPGEEAKHDETDASEQREEQIAAFLRGEPLPFKLSDLENEDLYQFVKPWATGRPTITKQEVLLSFGLGQTRAARMIQWLADERLIEGEVKGGQARKVLVYQLPQQEEQAEEAVLEPDPGIV